MSVELPFAPVDTIIRRNADGLRVSADATEVLARHIQERGARIAVGAAERAAGDGRKTLQASDFGTTETPAPEELELPIAPVDRIARLDIDDRYRVGADARVALAEELEREADRVAIAAARLAEHADRRTIIAADVETFLALPE